MAATHTSIGLVATIADIKAALNAKALITEVKYETDTYLIFTTPLLSGGKVVKIYYGTYIRVSVGSGWTSGSTITDEYYFNYAYSSSSIILDAINMIADTNFFMLVYTDTDQGYLYHGIAYIGALENGDEFVFGLVGAVNSAHNANNRAKNLTDGIELYPVTWNRQFASSSGKILTQKLMWSNSATGVLEENTDGTPAGTMGVKLCSAANSNITITVVAGSHLITPAFSYMHGGMKVTESSLLSEFS